MLILGSLARTAYTRHRDADSL